MRIYFRNVEGMRSMSVFLRLRGAVPDFRVQLHPFKMQTRAGIMRDIKRDDESNPKFQERD